jgi:hypothetical protein
VQLENKIQHILPEMKQQVDYAMKSALYPAIAL